MMMDENHPAHYIDMDARMYDDVRDHYDQSATGRFPEGHYMDIYRQRRGIIRPRQTANARERDRTQSVNSAFVTLRHVIPTEPANRKLSKIETLRLATSYISHLHTVLMAGYDCMDQPCMKHREIMRLTARHATDDTSVVGNGPAHICTFCLSASKVSKTHEVKSESCMYRSRQPSALQTTR